jgi:hypothetical protein
VSTQGGSDGGRFRGFRKRILGDEEGRSLFGDARDVLGNVFEGSDKVRGELFRAVAREVRAYLEELGLKEDLHNLLTNYALELHLSLNLRRLAEREKQPRGRRRGKVPEETVEEPPVPVTEPEPEAPETSSES